MSALPPFPSLTVLTVGRCSMFIPDTVVKKQDAKWARLVRLNPTLQDTSLLLVNDPESGPVQFLEAVFTTLLRPKRLELRGVGRPEVSYGTQQLFWKAVSRFEELVYTAFDQSRRGLY
ncbi:hypothetical protein BGZ47_005281 [Haplosporangium gracile]|nr:hypothetical protein BGZ47_005281 [Haplosporangium gracile]